MLVRLLGLSLGALRCYSLRWPGGVGWGWPMAAQLVVFSVPPSVLQRRVSNRVSGPGGSVSGFCGDGGEL